MKKIPRISVMKAIFERLKTHPDATIPTGIWDDPRWSADRFRRWFSGCLAEKILSREPARPWRKLQPEYQHAFGKDARIISDYGRRVRHAGRNLLDLPEMKARFPHIDNQPSEQ